MQMWKNSTISIFWPDTSNSYKNISTLRLLAQCSPSPPPHTHISFFYFQKKKSEITQKWTSPALRRLQKDQAISEMTVAAATDPPM